MGSVELILFALQHTSEISRTTWKCDRRRCATLPSLSKALPVSGPPVSSRLRFVADRKRGACRVGRQGQRRNNKLTCLYRQPREAEPDLSSQQRRNKRERTVLLATLAAGLPRAEGPATGSGCRPVPDLGGGGCHAFFYLVLVRKIGCPSTSTVSS